MAQEEAEEEVEEVAEKAASPFKSLFGGRPKQAQQQVATLPVPLLKLF